MKAEAAKLPGAGIGPKQCPRKCAEEKDYLPKSVRIGVRSRLERSGTVRIIRIARPLWGRLAWRGGLGDSKLQERLMQERATQCRTSKGQLETR